MSQILETTIANLEAQQQEITAVINLLRNQNSVAQEKKSANTAQSTAKVVGQPVFSERKVNPVSGGERLRKGELKEILFKTVRRANNKLTMTKLSESVGRSYGQVSIAVKKHSDIFGISDEGKIYLVEHKQFNPPEVADPEMQDDMIADDESTGE